MMLEISWAVLMPWNNIRGYFEGAVFAFRSKSRVMFAGGHGDVV
jgi:hypothetical protein